MGKLDDVKAKKAALLKKLDELEKIESAALDEQKKKRDSVDERVYKLLGICCAEMMKRDKPGRLFESMLSPRIADLKKPDRELIGNSELWRELIDPVVVSAEPAERTEPSKPHQALPNTPETPPAARQVATASVVTPLRTSYYDRDEVKRLGAVWNPTAPNPNPASKPGVWEVPAGVDLTPFKKWL